jgi:very-short-patch-repair endonuclease
MDSYRCGDCGKAYKTLAGLRKHKQLTHGRKTPKKHTTGSKRRGYTAHKKATVKGKTMAEIKQHLMENMSQLEKDFMMMLDTFGIKYDSQYQIGTKFFDFYLPDYNIILEVDGDYHHCNPAIYKKPTNATQRKAIKNDQKKNRLCEEKGIQLLRFWENDIRNKRDIVIAKLMLALNLF